MISENKAELYFLEISCCNKILDKIVEEAFLGEVAFETEAELIRYKEQHAISDSDECEKEHIKRCGIYKITIERVE